MQLDAVRSALSGAGYDVAELSVIAEGSNHHVYDVLLQNGTPVICKFAKIRQTDVGITAANTDTLFGGRLSLDRESYLLALARNEGGLPVPEVYGVHNSDLGRFIMVEKSPGMSFTAYQKAHAFRLPLFLDSLRALGRNFGVLHSRVRLPSFGDIQTGGVIEPGDDNFADRFGAVTEMRINRAVRKGVFDIGETERVHTFFRDKFEAMRPQLTVEAAPPVMVFTDMHGENYFVDGNGVPSGYFDLESSQAAPAALEFYGFRFFLFNNYDAGTYEKAEAVFWEGYKAAGGPYYIRSQADDDLIHLLAGCRLLELSESYWGHVDGLRDTWAQRIKDLLFRYMDTGVVDYLALGAIWRERDGQPLIPNP